MGAIENGVTCLHVQQIQLNGVAGVDVLIREEEFASQQHGFGFVDALFAQRFSNIHPVD